MKIVLLLTISNLVISSANQGVRRYFMNIECESLTQEQCAAKADETYQEYCMTNNDDCTNYNIFGYDEFSIKGIGYSTITECINNDGVIMKCECHEGFLDSSETQRGMICRTESGTDDELTTLTPIIPTTEPITSDISTLTPEHNYISTSETLESEIDTTEKLTTTETASTMRDVSTASEQTTISTSETTEAETVTTSREVLSVTSEQTSTSLSESTEADVETTAKLTVTETMSTINDVPSSASEQTTVSLSETTKTETTTDEELESVPTSTLSGAVTTISDVSTGTSEREILIREGWSEANNGVLYKLFIDSANFTEARSKCEERGAILAAKVIRDPTSYSKITALISESPWIGLNNVTTEGTLVWEDGVEATGDDFLWIAEQSNSSGGNDCWRLLFFLLVQSDCGLQNNSYLCEKNA